MIAAINHFHQGFSPISKVKTSKETLFSTAFEQGNYEAFKQVFKKFYNPLCHHAYKYVHSREVAEEIVSDVFMKIWKNRLEIEIHTSYESYLYRCVRNLSLDFLKSKQHNQNCLDQDIETAYHVADFYNPEQSMIYEEFYSKVQSAIEALPPQCRLIFKMSRDDGYTYQEIANNLGLSIKTIETQVGRALKILRGKLL